jgi:hypothetical protein
MSQKQNRPYILLIMNCVQYKEKAQKQKNTWLKDLHPSVVYYHVIGIPLLDRDFILSETSRVLYVKTKDDYNSLPQKVIAAYDAICCSFDFQYIFKTDDDQNVFSEHFFEMILQRIESKTEVNTYYGGKIIDVKKPYHSQYHKIHSELPPNLPILQTKYCNGRFYFLHREAVQSLVDKKKLFQYEFLEDYAVGFHLEDKYKENILFIDSDKFLQDF